MSVIGKSLYPNTFPTFAAQMRARGVVISRAVRHVGSTRPICLPQLLLHLNPGNDGTEMRCECVVEGDITGRVLKPRSKFLVRVLMLAGCVRARKIQVGMT